MFFFLAFVFGSIGPGSVASAALIGPMAMTVAAQIGVPAFLMAIMVANGAGSASLSPIGPTGIIVNTIFEKIGMPAVPWQNYAIVFIAHATVAFAGYFALGGWKIFRAAESTVVDVDRLAVMPAGKVPNGDVPMPPGRSNGNTG